MRLIVASHYFLLSIGSGSSSVTSSDLGCVLQKPLSAQRHHHAWLGWFLSCRVDFGRWYTSIYTLLCHLPQSCILLSIKMTQQTWCHIWLQLLFHPIQGRGGQISSVPCSVLCCPKPPWEDVCMSASVDVCGPGDVTLLLVPGCDCTSKDSNRVNTVWLRKETD